MGDAGSTVETGVQLFDHIRHKVDPDNTLPNVVLEREEAGSKQGTLIPTSYRVLHNGEVIGKTTLVKDRKSKTAWFTGVKVDDSHRGSGFGLAAYVAGIELAIQDGLTFRTHDWSQSQGAKHIWDILVEKGVAKVVEPFKSDRNGKFMGHCEVLSMKELEKPS